MGTSFGMTSDLLRFWGKSGFKPLYLRQVGTRGGQRQSDARWGLERTERGLQSRQLESRPEAGARLVLEGSGLQGG